MKNLHLKVMVLVTLLGLFGFKKSEDPSNWSAKQIDKWYEKGEWLGKCKAIPDESINRREFAISYFKLKDRWDKAFEYMSNPNLKDLEAKRYDIDGNNLYALVQQYNSKNEADARYESHKKYIDIQYVLSGKELMGIGPMSDLQEIQQPYNESSDIQYFSVSKITNRKAEAGRFLIFFPSDAHRPGLKDGENSPVKKVVLKLKID